VKGGFFAVLPSSGDLPPCAAAASDISGNAFYCADRDVVAWDAEQLLPELRDKFGDFVIPVVLAHEWGHAIQARSDTSTYHISPGDLDEGIKALLVFRGEGDTDRQGAGFERVRAFREGVMNGAESCVGYQG
jgi:hypothetical protein